MSVGAPWLSISPSAQTGERILVTGGTLIRGNEGSWPQAFPSLVMWDGIAWVICDNAGPRSVIERPTHWCAVPPPIR